MMSDSARKLSRQSKVVASQEQVSCNLSAETVLLNLRSGVYFGLNTVGASIFKLIQEPRTIKEIREALVEEYDVEPKSCEKDILELLEELSSHGLIDVVDERST
jgi:hypothetical protein